MTITIGFIDGRVLILASDSSSSTPDEIEVRANNSKLYRVNIGPCNVLVGFAGDFGMCTWIRYGLNWPSWRGPEHEDFHSWLVRRLAPAIEKSLKQRFPDSSYEARCEWELMVGLPSLREQSPRLFKICSSGDVAEPLGNFAAIGSGEKAALASLHVLKTLNLTSWECIEKSMEACAERTPSVKKPWNVIYEMT